MGRPYHGGVLLLSPEEQSLYGRTLEEALACCLVWLMAPEIAQHARLMRVRKTYYVAEC